MSRCCWPNVAESLPNLLGDTYGTRAQIALRFAPANPDIASIDIGLGAIAHIEEAAQAAAAGRRACQARKPLRYRFRGAIAAPAEKLPNNPIPMPNS